MYGSLGRYIDELERRGELLRITAPVSADCEIAEITERIAKSEGGGRALLFENTGTAFPVATNIMGSERRMALALGVESLDEISQRIESLLREVTAPKNSLADKLRMLPLLGEMSRWLPRTTKSRGACQQVVLTGDEASLDLLPVLRCRALDGGRFITLPMVHTIDPETGMRNVGMYRMQLFDARTTGMHWHRHKTGARHYDAYKALGRRMPVAVAIGGDPVYAYCATAPMPDNMDEYLLAGFLRRRSVQLVKCITNDIYVPADCDFVIEGYVDPSEPLATEGDFGDHTGFYSLTDLYPRFHVTAITHRRDAVYPATVVGIPPQEDAFISMATERIFLAPIRLALQPEVEGLTMPTAGTSHNIAVVSIRKRYDGQAVKVAQSLWGAGQMMFNKYMVICPHGCDIRSAGVLSAALRSCDPARCVIRSEGIYDVLDHATPTCGYGGKLALDLTGFRPNDGADSTADAGSGGTGADATPRRPHMPANIVLPEGVTSFSGEFLERWSVLALFGDNDAAVDIGRFADENAIDCNFIVLFDSRAAQMNGEELLWLAAANTEPSRDVVLHGSTLIVDARPKRPAAGAAEAVPSAARDGKNPARWPNVVISSPETVALVDRRWAEYGAGGFVPSPSERYAQLMLSDGAQW